VNPTIGAIPIPAGYHRAPAATNSFSAWLRNIPLKKDRTVYLYNNSPKRNQEAQFAALDISVGKQDLQQCADAVMRLRAEYLYSINDYDNINYYTEQGIRLNFREWLQGHRFHLSGNHLVSYRVAPAPLSSATRSAVPRTACRTAFDEYLNTVFTWCGTRSLEKQLLPRPVFKDIQAGDVLIKGGSPGHAMLVADIAEDAHGHRRTSSELRPSLLLVRSLRYRSGILAQSYMPAQDIHIVNNPSNPTLSPWYRADEPGANIQTPEWTFRINELRTWPHSLKNHEYSGEIRQKSTNSYIS